MVKAVFFDWDGVIMDSVLMMPGYLDYLSSLTGVKNNYRTPEEVRRDFTEPFPTFYITIGFDWEKQSELVYGSYRKYFSGRVVPPVKGISDVVKSLKSDGFRLGIASSNFEEVIHSRLEEYSLEGLFDSVVGHGDADAALLKPHPHVLNRLLENMKLSPNDAIYIGDQPSDIMAAKAAGMKSIGVEWGYSTRKKLEAQSPDFIISSPSEILDVIRGL